MYSCFINIHSLICIFPICFVVRNIVYERAQYYVRSFTTLRTIGRNITHEENERRYKKQRGENGFLLNGSIKRV